MTEQEKLYPRLKNAPKSSASKGRNMKYILLAIIFLSLVNANAQAQQERQLGSRFTAKQNNSTSKMNNLTYEDRAKWRKALNWSDECEKLFDTMDHTQSGLTFWNLGNNKYLVEVECALLAYQPVQLYFYYDKSTLASVSHQLTFSTYDIDTSGQVVPQEESMISGLGTFTEQSKT